LGKNENKANSAQLKLELGLRLANNVLDHIPHGLDLEHSGLQPHNQLPVQISGTKCKVALKTGYSVQYLSPRNNYSVQSMSLKTGYFFHKSNPWHSKQDTPRNGQGILF
jgi:hypothetical protein